MVLCVRWYVTDRDAVARSVAKFDLTGGARALIDIAGRGGEG